MKKKSKLKIFCAFLVTFQRLFQLLATPVAFLGAWLENVLNIVDFLQKSRAPITEYIRVISYQKRTMFFLF